MCTFCSILCTLKNWKWFPTIHQFTLCARKLHQVSGECRHWLFELGVLPFIGKTFIIWKCVFCFLFFSLRLHFFISLFSTHFSITSSSTITSCSTFSFSTFALAFVSIWYFCVRLASFNIKVKEKTKQTKNEQRKFKWERMGFNEMLKCAQLPISLRYGMNRV